MARLVLLPSPLTRAVAWGRLPEALASSGSQVTVVEPDDADEPPYAARWVAACARQVAQVGAGPVVLVGHSGAGPLLAALGYALRAAHRPVAAYAFLDAGLPRAAPGSRLDSFVAEDPEAAGELRRHLAGGGLFPEWSVVDLEAIVPGLDDREALVRGLRPRGLAFWTEAMPELQDWPDAPCTYLRTSAGYDVALREATLRGWPTARLDLGHFPGLTGPVETAAALMGLLMPLLPSG